MEEEDVMPPPSKGTSFAFKTNADFRRMLETPRPQRFQEGVVLAACSQVHVSDYLSDDE